MARSPGSSLRQLARGPHIFNTTREGAIPVIKSCYPSDTVAREGASSTRHTPVPAFSHDGPVPLCACQPVTDPCFISCLSLLRAYVLRRSRFVTGWRAAPRTYSRAAMPHCRGPLLLFFELRLISPSGINRPGPQALMTAPTLCACSGVFLMGFPSQYTATTPCSLTHMWICAP